jgi:hypothetical protein
MDVFINGSFVGTLEPPFNYSFSPESLENLKDENELRLNVYDSVYNSREVISTFRVGL